MSYVFSVVVLSQVLVVTVAYRLERATMYADLDTKVNVVAGLMVSSAEKALTEYDATNVGLLMDRALRDHDFVSLRLLDESRYPVMERSGTGVMLQKVEYPVNRGAQKIGTLEVTYSASRIYHELIKRVVWKVVVMGSAIALLAVVIMIFFRHWVVRRVVEIDAALGRITEGDLVVALEEVRGDELGHIASGINALTGQLSRTIGRSAAVSKQVFDTTNVLMRSFDESTRSMCQQYTYTEEISRAIENVSQSQSQIARNTEELYQSANENTEAVRQAMEISQDIASSIDLLGSGMNEAHATMASLDAATRKVATMAVQATEQAVSAGTTAGDVRSSITAVSRLVDASAEETERTTRIIYEKGIPSFNDADRAMTRIQALSESLGQTIGGLDTGSKDIAKILAVISDVTERTKLLSLNASIIAAQTGEHGKGFAVVAQEMKLLSDQTAQSTKEIVGILSSIQDGIGDAVNQTREASCTVKEGRGVVTHAGEALHQILDASRSSSSMVREMAAAATLQQERLEQIVAAMGRLRDLNSGVSRAMNDEQANITELSTTIGDLCASMDVARQATDQQAGTMGEMMNSLRAATGQIKEIAREAVANEKESNVIVHSVRDVVAVTALTTDTLSAASAKLSELIGQTEQLLQEMSRFKTDSANHSS